MQYIITAAFSHLHFDHVGGHARFEAVASLDHPVIRARTDAEGRFTPSLLQHGAPGRPTFRITEWWALDADVELGGRTLGVLSVPGHTPESIALFDAGRGQLFTGDFLYPGDLFAFVPGSDLAAYRESARRLLSLFETTPDVAIYGAHVPTPETAVRQTVADLRRLERGLGELLERRAGRGEIAWFLCIPVRRHRFGEGLAILTPVF